MEKTEKAIFTVLVMISDPQGNILVEDRRDPGWPGVCFPGGHVEPGESFTAAAIRETYEETGLTVEDPTLCGVKQFQTEENARYVVFFYKAARFHGELSASDEGAVFWVRRDQLADLNLVSDFLDMVKVFESDDLSEFFYRQKDGRWTPLLL